MADPFANGMWKESYHFSVSLMAINSIMFCLESLGYLKFGWNPIGSAIWTGNLRAPWLGMDGKLNSAALSVKFIWTTI